MGRTARVTREQVLAAAREEFVTRGFEGATLAAIGAKLAVSPAALLRHAPTKRDLFVASMRPPQMPDMDPLAFLEELSGSEDPRAVLRRAGEAMVPFLESKIHEVVALWVYFKQVPGVGRLPLPFDPESRPTPPQRNLRYLENYFRRAVRRGRLRLENPAAAAFAFLSTLHSFVFLQHVVQALEKPMALDVYLDTVLDVWTRGAVCNVAAPRGRKR
jgi:TetR/AcrR family transcriptional regulator, mexJK operon transcriptional repressor